MTKSELIDVISEKLPSLSKKDVSDAVNNVFDAMTDALSKNDRIEIRGFGSFTVKHRHSRDGRNPKTGVEVLIAPRRVMTFRASQIMRDRIAKG